MRAIILINRQGRVQQWPRCLTARRDFLVKLGETFVIEDDFEPSAKVRGRYGTFSVDSPTNFVVTFRNVRCVGKSHLQGAGDLSVRMGVSSYTNVSQLNFESIFLTIAR